MRNRVAVILGLLMCWTAPAALAGEVKLLTESSQVYVGVPFAVAIDVTASEKHEAPEFPEIEGATSELINTSTSMRTSHIIINGRQMGGTEETTRYLYNVTPLKQGILTIPRIEVDVDGEKLSTRSANFRATVSEKGDLLYVELVGAEDKVYVGEPIDVTLRVWLKEYKQRRTQLNYREMWQAIDKNATDWGVFEDLVMRQNPDVKIAQMQRVGDDGRKYSYNVYEIRKEVWPTRPGKFEAGGVRIVVNYPLKVSRDVFGSVRFSETKPIFATIDTTNVNVLDVPTKGRPPGFSGAVGSHSIRATATPNHVRVGDPITLNITVEGESQLEHLQAPHLKEVPGFNDQFQISDDTLPGVVDGRRKTFSLSLRALSDQVHEIPRIPLPYFDTDSETFKTVYSEPIPLDVDPAQKMSTMDIVQSGEPAMQNESRLTRLNAGIEANRSDIDSLLADQRLKLVTIAAPVVVGAPLVFMACLLIRRRSEFRKSNSGLMTQRAAFKTALSRLDAINRSSGSAKDQDTALNVILVYIRDRLMIGSEVLTRSDAAQALTDAGVSADVVESTNRVIADCEAAEFGGRSHGDDVRHAGDVRTMIEQIEKQLGKRK
ncbi:MAG: BatD family protein [Phycisphaerae bacterium]|nr:BatD family protein [Phycisphaerales bacterium]